MLQGIWKYYKYSCKAVREIKELAAMMGERAYKAVKADGSRWIPHLKRALKVLLTKNYKLVVTHFHHASAKMQGTATNCGKKLTRYLFVKFLHLLLDIVEQVSKVYLVFQREEGTIALVQDEINALNASLEALKTRPGEHLRSFERSADADNRFNDIVLSKKDTDDPSFLTTRDTLIDLAKQYISSRFSNVNDNSVLKAAASITEPLLWPKDRAALRVYGEDHLDSLINHFDHLITGPTVAFNELTCKDE